MSFLDRLGRSLFVALAVGLGWGIRGDFGHLVGAMYPGAALCLAFAYVSGQASLFRWMPLLAALSGLGIGAGGRMSYGILHGYAQSDTLINFSYGFFTLLLQGGAWGVFGCAAVGLMLERKKVSATEWVGLGLTIYAAGWCLYHLVVTLIGFHINPEPPPKLPRSDASIAFTGAAIGLFAWLVLNRKWIGLRGALFGYAGFGLGMTIGRLLGNLAREQPIPAEWGLAVTRFLGDTQGKFPIPINDWNVMETMCGFIGGFVFCWGMVGIRCADPPKDENVPFLSLCSMVYVLGVIPLLHRMLRINDDKVAGWVRQLKSYGYSDPDGMGAKIVYGLDGICAVGFLGAAIWALLHFRDKVRWAALPVLWLSADMLLFQNTAALYPFYPRSPGSINMHFVFWVMFAMMALYVLIARPRPPEIEDSAEQVLWLGWSVATAMAVGLVILSASFVNGKRTMSSANTRFPIWNWTQGPFPGQGVERKDAEKGKQAEKSKESSEQKKEPGEKRKDSTDQAKEPATKPKNK